MKDGALKLVFVMFGFIVIATMLPDIIHSLLPLLVTAMVLAATFFGARALLREYWREKRRERDRH